MWVIFEGLDKSGKGTLEWEFLKATNFKHMVIDRGPVGYMLFDKLLGRTTKLGDHEFIRQARKIMKGKPEFMVVYCYTNEVSANKRAKACGEQPVSEVAPYDKGMAYDKAQKLYATNVTRYYKPERTIMLDTTDKSIDECTCEIVQKLEEVLKNELY